MRSFASSRDPDLRSQLTAAQDEISELRLQLGDQVVRQQRLEEDLRVTHSILGESRRWESAQESDENVHPQLSSLKQALEEVRKDNKFLREVCANQKGLNTMTNSPRDGHRTVQISSTSTLSANQRREVSEMIGRIESLHVSEKERLEKEKMRVVVENERLLLDAEASKGRHKDLLSKIRGMEQQQAEEVQATVAEINGLSRENKELANRNLVLEKMLNAARQENLLVGDTLDLDESAILERSDLPSSRPQPAKPKVLNKQLQLQLREAQRTTDRLLHSVADTDEQSFEWFLEHVKPHTASKEELVVQVHLVQSELVLARTKLCTLEGIIACMREEKAAMVHSLMEAEFWEDQHPTTTLIEGGKPALVQAFRLRDLRVLASAMNSWSRAAIHTAAPRHVLFQIASGSQERRARKIIAGLGKKLRYDNASELLQHIPNVCTRLFSRPPSRLAFEGWYRATSTRRILEHMARLVTNFVSQRHRRRIFKAWTEHHRVHSRMVKMLARRLLGLKKHLLRAFLLAWHRHYLESAALFARGLHAARKFRKQRVVNAFNSWSAVKRALRESAWRLEHFTQRQNEQKLKFLLSLWRLLAVSDGFTKHIDIGSMPTRVLISVGSRAGPVVKAVANQESDMATQSQTKSLSLSLVERYFSAVRKKKIVCMLFVRWSDYASSESRKLQVQRCLISLREQKQISSGFFCWAGHAQLEARKFQSGMKMYGKCLARLLQASFRSWVMFFLRTETTEWFRTVVERQRTHRILHRCLSAWVQHLLRSIPIVHDRPVRVYQNASFPEPDGRVWVASDDESEESEGLSTPITIETVPSTVTSNFERDDLQGFAAPSAFIERLPTLVGDDNEFHRLPSTHRGGVDAIRLTSTHSVGVDSGRSPSAHSVGVDPERLPSTYSVGVGPGRLPSTHIVGVHPGELGLLQSARRVGFDLRAADHLSSMDSVNISPGQLPSTNSVGVDPGEFDRLASAHSVGVGPDRLPSTHSVGVDPREFDRLASGRSVGVGPRRLPSTHSVGLDPREIDRLASAHSVGVGPDRLPSTHSVGVDPGEFDRLASAHSVGVGPGRLPSAHSVGVGPGEFDRLVSAHSVGVGPGRLPSTHSIGLDPGEFDRLASAHSVGVGPGRLPSTHSVGLDPGEFDRLASAHSVGVGPGRLPSILSVGSDSQDFDRSTSAHSVGVGPGEFDRLASAHSVGVGPGEFDRMASAHSVGVGPDRLPSTHSVGVDPGEFDRLASAHSVGVGPDRLPSTYSVGVGPGEFDRLASAHSVGVGPGRLPSTHSVGVDPREFDRQASAHSVGVGPDRLPSTHSVGVDPREIDRPASAYSVGVGPGEFDRLVSAHSVGVGPGRLPLILSVGSDSQDFDRTTSAHSVGVGPGEFDRLASAHSVGVGPDRLPSAHSVGVGPGEFDRLASAQHRAHPPAGARPRPPPPPPSVPTSAHSVGVGPGQIASTHSIGVGPGDFDRLASDYSIGLGLGRLPSTHIVGVDTRDIDRVASAHIVEIELPEAGHLKADAQTTTGFDSEEVDGRGSFAGPAAMEPSINLHNRSALDQSSASVLGVSYILGSDEEPDMLPQVSTRNLAVAMQEWARVRYRRRDLGRRASLLESRRNSGFAHSFFEEWSGSTSNRKRLHKVADYSRRLRHNHLVAPAFLAWRVCTHAWSKARKFDHLVFGIVNAQLLRSVLRLWERIVITRKLDSAATMVASGGKETAWTDLYLRSVKEFTAATETTLREDVARSVSSFYRGSELAARDGIHITESETAGAQVVVRLCIRGPWGTGADEVVDALIKQSTDSTSALRAGRVTRKVIGCMAVQYASRMVPKKDMKLLGEVVGQWWLVCRKSAVALRAEKVINKMAEHVNTAWLPEFFWQWSQVTLMSQRWREINEQLGSEARTDLVQQAFRQLRDNAKEEAGYTNFLSERRRQLASVEHFMAGLHDEKTRSSHGSLNLWRTFTFWRRFSGERATMERSCRLPLVKLSRSCFEAWAGFTGYCRRVDYITLRLAKRTSGMQKQSKWAAFQSWSAFAFYRKDFSDGLRYVDGKHHQLVVQMLRDVVRSWCLLTRARRRVTVAYDRFSIRRWKGIGRSCLVEWQLWGWKKRSLRHRSEAVQTRWMTRVLTACLEGWSKAAYRCATLRAIGFGKKKATVGDGGPQSGLRKVFADWRKGAKKLQRWRGAEGLLSHRWNVMLLQETVACLQNAVIRGWLGRELEKKAAGIGDTRVCMAWFRRWITACERVKKTSEDANKIYLRACTRDVGSVFKVLRVNTARSRRTTIATKLLDMKLKRFLQMVFGTWGHDLHRLRIQMRIETKSSVREGWFLLRLAYSQWKKYMEDGGFNLAVWEVERDRKASTQALSCWWDQCRLAKNLKVLRYQCNRKVEKQIKAAVLRAWKLRYHKVWWQQRRRKLINFVSINRRRQDLKLAIREWLARSRYQVQLSSASDLCVQSLQTRLRRNVLSLWQRVSSERACANVFRLQRVSTRMASSLFSFWMTWHRYKTSTRRTVLHCVQVRAIKDLVDCFERWQLLTNRDIAAQHKESRLSSVRSLRFLRRVWHSWRTFGDEQATKTTAIVRISYGSIWRSVRNVTAAWRELSHTNSKKRRVRDHRCLQISLSRHRHMVLWRFGEWRHVAETSRAVQYRREILVKASCRTTVREWQRATVTGAVRRHLSKHVEQLRCSNEIRQSFFEWKCQSQQSKRALWHIRMVHDRACKTHIRAWQHAVWCKAQQRCGMARLGAVQRSRERKGVLWGWRGECERKRYSERVESRVQESGEGRMVRRVFHEWSAECDKVRHHWRWETAIKRRGELDLIRRAMGDWIEKRDAAVFHDHVEKVVTTSGGIGLLRRSFVEWCSQTNELRTHVKVEQKVTSAGGTALSRRVMFNWRSWSSHRRRLNRLKLLLCKRFDRQRMSMLLKSWYSLLAGSMQTRSRNRAVSRAQQARSHGMVAAAFAEWQLQATEGRAMQRKCARAMHTRRQRTMRRCLGRWRIGSEDRTDKVLDFTALSIRRLVQGMLSQWCVWGRFQAERREQEGRFVEFFASRNKGRNLSPLFPYVFEWRRLRGRYKKTQMLVKRANKTQSRRIEQSAVQRWRMACLEGHARRSKVANAGDGRALKLLRAAWNTWASFLDEMASKSTGVVKISFSAVWRCLRITFIAWTDASRRKARRRRVRAHLCKQIGRSRHRREALLSFAEWRTSTLHSRKALQCGKWVHDRACKTHIRAWQHAVWCKAQMRCGMARLGAVQRSRERKGVLWGWRGECERKRYSERVEIRVQDRGARRLMKRALIEWHNRATLMCFIRKKVKRLKHRQNLSAWQEQSTETASRRRWLGYLQSVIGRRYNRVRLAKVLKSWCSLRVKSTQEWERGHVANQVQKSLSRSVVATALAEWQTQAATAIAEQRKCARAMHTRRQRTMRRCLGRWRIGSEDRTDKVLDFTALSIRRLVQGMLSQWCVWGRFQAERREQEGRFVEFFASRNKGRNLSPLFPYVFEWRRLVIKGKKLVKLGARSVALLQRKIQCQILRLWHADTAQRGALRSGSSSWIRTRDQKLEGRVWKTWSSFVSGRQKVSRAMPLLAARERSQVQRVLVEWGTECGQRRFRVKAAEQLRDDNQKRILSKVLHGWYAQADYRLCLNKAMTFMDRGSGIKLLKTCLATLKQLVRKHQYLGTSMRVVILSCEHHERNQCEDTLFYSLRGWAEVHRQQRQLKIWLNGQQRSRKWRLVERAMDIWCYQASLVQQQLHVGEESVVRSLSSLLTNTLAVWKKQCSHRHVEHEALERGVRAQSRIGRRALSIWRAHTEGSKRGMARNRGPVVLAAAERARRVLETVMGQYSPETAFHGWVNASLVPGLARKVGEYAAKRVARAQLAETANKWMHNAKTQREARGKTMKCVRHRTITLKRAALWRWCGEITKSHTAASLGRMHSIASRNINSAHKASVISKWRGWVKNRERRLVAGARAMAITDAGRRYRAVEAWLSVVPLKELRAEEVLVNIRDMGAVAEMARSTSVQTTSQAARTTSVQATSEPDERSTSVQTTSRAARTTSVQATPDVVERSTSVETASQGARTTSVQATSEAVERSTSVQTTSQAARTTSVQTAPDVVERSTSVQTTSRAARTTSVQATAEAVERSTSVQTTAPDMEPQESEQALQVIEELKGLNERISQQLEERTESLQALQEAIINDGEDHEARIQSLQEQHAKQIAEKQSLVKERETWLRQVSKQLAASQRKNEELEERLIEMERLEEKLAEYENELLQLNELINP